MAFPMSFLSDSFENNTIDPLWTTIISGSATATETGGQAVLTLPNATAGAHQAFYTSKAAYDLTGDACAVAVGTMVATGVAATAYILQLVLDANNYYQWVQTSNTLKAQKIVAGVATDLYSVTWSATTYKYLRIRESGGTVSFDSSTSASAGAAWTNRATQTVAGAFAVTSLAVQFGAACGNIASPGALKLDLINTPLPAPTSTWRYTTADWQIVNRMRPVTLASSGNAQGVIVTAGSMDSAGVLGGTVRYFAGPVGSSSGGYAALTEYASLALAQASAFDIPIDGRVDLPALLDCRLMRLYHRSTDGSSYTLREYVPRRIVQADDIEAESIRAINIAAGTITADKIYAAFTITGKNIQTALSGARVVLSGDPFGGIVGYAATDTYDTVAGTGTYQLRWSLADGKLYAGGGTAILDNNGIAVKTNNISGSYSAPYAYSVISSVGTDIAYLTNVETVSKYTWQMRQLGDATHDGDITLRADKGGAGGASAIIELQGNGSAGAAGDILLQSDSIRINATTSTTISGGLNVGSATGAATGQIGTSGSVGIGVAAQSNVRLFVKAQDATSSNYALFLQDSAAATLCYVRDDKVGFLNNTAWTYSSDARLKERIVDLDRGLADLLGLRPVRFDYIDGESDQYGFIAQDVQTVMPELVTAVDHRGYLGMKTTSLIPVLVNAVRALHERIAHLEHHPA